MDVARRRVSGLLQPVTDCDTVMNDIAAALKLDGLPETARKALKNLYEYLNTHQYHIIKYSASPIDNRR